MLARLLSIRFRWPMQWPSSSFVHGQKLLAKHAWGSVVTRDDLIQLTEHGKSKLRQTAFRQSDAWAEIAVQALAAKCIEAAAHGHGERELLTEAFPAFATDHLSRTELRELLIKHLSKQLPGVHWEIIADAARQQERMQNFFVRLVWKEEDTADRDISRSISSASAASAVEGAGIGAAGSTVSQHESKGQEVRVGDDERRTEF